MITADIQQIVREQVASELAFREFDNERLGVAFPLTFGDGDACEMVLTKQDDGRYLISDEGHVLALARMQGVNLLSAGYRERFLRLAAFYGAHEVRGAIQATAEFGSLGDSLFSFCQACLELARLMDRQPEAKRKRRAFTKRFSRIVTAAIPRGLLESNWYDRESDPNGIYPADYRANDFLIYGAGSPGKAWKSTAAVQHLRGVAGKQVQTVFAFSESTERDAGAMAALADNADKMFSLERQRRELDAYLRSTVSPA